MDTHNDNIIRRLLLNSSMRRTFCFYLTILTLFGIGTYLILAFGFQIHLDTTLQGKLNEGISLLDMNRALKENLQSPLSRLLLQIIIIIGTAQGIGKLFQKIGQPAVIGEMVAGILLGPSLLGMLSPTTSAFLFPPSSLGVLQLLSQIGVILFMFLIGMELDLQHLRRNALATVVISHASILIPFFLGATLAVFIYRTLAPPNVPYIGFALFMAIAMSITAFPVLARIIEERGLSKSPLGNTAIACAAIDDVTAWCILAVVIAIVKIDVSGASLLLTFLPTIILALAFIGMMFLFIRPCLAYLLGKQNQEQDWSKGHLGKIVIFALASAMCTEVIGIHALFGAFLAGVVMPSQTGLRLFVRERLETISSTILLPIFFAFTGLRTQIHLLNDWQSWTMCLVVIFVAIVGKMGGGMLAARWTGMNSRDAFGLGILMNTRGLMELIVLNIGYDLGVLSGRIFAMMVIMALVTTFMTGPLISLVTKPIRYKPGSISQ